MPLSASSQRGVGQGLAAGEANRAGVCRLPARRPPAGPRPRGRCDAYDAPGWAAEGTPAIPSALLR